MSAENGISGDLAEYYRRVLEEAGVTDHELTRFVHLMGRSRTAALLAVAEIDLGMPAADAIDGYAEIVRRRQAGEG